MRKGKVSRKVKGRLEKMRGGGKASIVFPGAGTTETGLKTTTHIYLAAKFLAFSQFG